MLDWHKLSSWRTIVFCCRCATMARIAAWPSPYDLAEVFSAKDLMLYLGLNWYSPCDLRQEPALNRFFRTKA